jgi:hypothetical protein
MKIAAIHSTRYRCDYESASAGQPDATRHAGTEVHLPAIRWRGDLYAALNLQVQDAW